MFSALSAIDQKKARRRNIVPARIGYFALLFMCCYGPIYCGLYMIQIQLGISNNIILRYMSGISGFRSYLISFITDSLYCILCPVIIILNSASTRGHARRWLKWQWQPLKGVSSDNAWVFYMYFFLFSTIYFDKGPSLVEIN